jgi:hypothetical protein
MLFQEFTKQKVKDANDLIAINGQITSYSFVDRSRHRYFVIRLLEYPAIFQIPADFIESFLKTRFQSDLKKGDSLWVSIPKKNENKLSSNEHLFIFSARAKTTTYLNEQDTLRIYNGYFKIFMSLLFFLIGSALIIWKPKYSLIRRAQTRHVAEDRFRGA